MSEPPPQTSTSPPSHDVKLFLSAVTDEFEPKDGANGVAYRSQLRQHLQHPNVTVKDQKEIMEHAAGVPLLVKLDEYIKACDAVVHLVGDMTGAIADFADVKSLLQLYPDLADRLPVLSDALQTGSPGFSYTQWEAYLAILHNRRLIIAQPDDTAPRGQRLSPDNPQTQAQQDHRARLKSQRYRPEITFANADNLAAQVATSAVVKLLARAHAQPKAKPNNIPFLSLGNLFVGREAFLEDVQKRLQSGRHFSAIVGAQAMHGLGGLGKTCAAVEYGLRHEHEYSALLFVAADQPETLHKSLSELCGPLVLNLPEQDVKDQTVRYAAVVNWLRKNPGWFLILDNVDDERAAAAVEGLLSQLQTGHVLITARFGEWSGGVERLDLEVLTPEASIKFLRDRTAGSRRLEPNDETAVAELANALGGLPLALEQAAAFIVAKQESFAGYLQRWKAHEQKVRIWHDPVRMNYPRSIAVTWDTSFAQLDSSSRALLNMLCWFDPDPIPVAVWQTPIADEAIVAGAKRLDANTTPIDAEDARAGLSRYGLILWQRGRAAFRVHRLVQEVTRKRLENEEQTATLTAALKVIDSYIPSDPPSSDVRSWPVWLPIRQHVTALVNSGDTYGIVAPTSRLMRGLGMLSNAKFLWREAEPLLRRALVIDEEYYGINHPNVGRALNDLAMLLKDMNNLPEAEPLMRRALAINEEVFGAEHPEVATNLSNLALLLGATNHLAEAEQLLRRALAIDELSYGTEHLDVARDLNNLATLLQTTNRLTEAEPLITRVVAIVEKRLGDSHPKVATALNNLAQLLKVTERLPEAERLMRRAMDIDKSWFGPDHPKFAFRLNNLALLFQCTNRLVEAAPLMCQAVAIFEKHCQEIGHDHPYLDGVIENYIQLLDQMQRSRREMIDCFASIGIPRNRIEFALPPPPDQGRNERCACGSGKKFKSCCGQ